MSKRFELNKEDYRRILRNVIVIYSPVIILGLDQIQSWSFDTGVLYALAISISIDALRRYLTDYTK
jgi:hypothetical protein